MDQKNRNILVIAIAITVFAAVFVCFGLPALMGVPEVTLAEVGGEEDRGEGSYLSVEVTPETVQSVIATLERPDSYRREITVTLAWTGGSASDRVQIWADGGYVKTVTSSGGAAQHRLVGDGRLCLWYTGDKTWQELPAGEATADLAQRIPTYEAVLELDPGAITAAGYETKNGRDCVYVEARSAALDTVDRYWIETATGLLCQAETLEGDRLVYAMEETSLTCPLERDYAFALPDGTVLHTSSGLLREEGGGQG